MASLVFIGHEASLTGAPYTQLYLIQWLRAHTAHTVQLVLLRGGPLLPEFEKVATVHVLHQYEVNPPFIQKLIRKAETLSGIRKAVIWNALIKSKPQLIFANTAPALEFAVEAKQRLQIPLIISIHELTSTFFYIDASTFARNSREIDFFLPCSQAVKDFYRTFCDIPDSKTRIVYDFAGDRPADISTAASMRQELNIPEGAKIIGGAGAFGWRKGTDLFLRVAYHFHQWGEKDVYFVWAGGDINSLLYKEIQHDIRLMGLEDRVLFVGTKTDLRGYYEAFDVFLLTSREDPFPLVCIEAALSACPLICFNNSGGMPEFVRQDAGFVVPYADTQAMAEQSKHLIRDTLMHSAMGMTAQQRASANHNIAAIGPQMYEVISSFLAQ